MHSGWHLALSSESHRHLAGSWSCFLVALDFQSQVFLLTSVQQMVARTNGPGVTACGWRDIPGRTKAEGQ